MAHILLVDDEAAVRDFLAELLQLDAHEVTTASDGHHAIRAVEQAPFDLMIIDLVMPEKEGIETIIEIRQKHPDLKIIAISGGGRGSAGDYLAMATQLGAARTLEKPFTNDTLLDTVRAVLTA